MGARQMAPPPANGWSLLLGCLGEPGDSNAKRETHSGQSLWHTELCSQCTHPPEIFLFRISYRASSAAIRRARGHHRWWPLPLAGPHPPGWHRLFS